MVLFLRLYQRLVHWWGWQLTCATSSSRRRWVRPRSRTPGWWRCTPSGSHSPQGWWPSTPPRPTFCSAPRPRREHLAHRSWRHRSLLEERKKEVEFGFITDNLDGRRLQRHWWNWKLFSLLYFIDKSDSDFPWTVMMFIQLAQFVQL